MDIQPQGCCYICMAKHFADAFYINATFNTPRCVAVPERVIAALFQTTAAQNGFKIILIVSRFHWFVRAAGQQIGVLRQTGNGFFRKIIISSGSGTMRTEDSLFGVCTIRRVFPFCRIRCAARSIRTVPFWKSMSETRSAQTSPSRSPPFAERRIPAFL